MRLRGRLDVSVMIPLMAFLFCGAEMADVVEYGAAPRPGSGNLSGAIIIVVRIGNDKNRCVALIICQIFLEEHFEIEPEAGTHFSEKFSRPEIARKYSTLAPFYRRLTLRDLRHRDAEVAGGHELMTLPPF